MYAILKEHDILRQKYNNNVYLLEEGKRLVKEYNEWLEMKEKEDDLFSESSSETKSGSGQQEEEFVIRVKGQNMTTLHKNVTLAADELKYSVKNILRKFRSDPTAAKAVLGRCTIVLYAFRLLVCDADGHFRNIRLPLEII